MEIKNDKIGHVFGSFPYWIGCHEFTDVNE